MLNKLMDQKTNIKLTFICRNPPEYSKIYNESDPHLLQLRWGRVISKIIIIEKTIPEEIYNRSEEQENTPSSKQNIC
jgi:hypothetical protein